MLAVGADLKNTVTLVVDGQAFVSQHIGDLNHYDAFRAFQETIKDLLSMYEVAADSCTIVRDTHPQYVSTTHALELAGGVKRAVQHHRAYIASVIAERGAWEKRVIGVSFDGTGYGDEGSIWGGEIFSGSVSAGFERVAHLRSAALPGGDAAASNPVQAAAGFLLQLNDHSPQDFAASPFSFPARFLYADKLARKNLRTFTTTSMGRLFDTAAALLGFTRETTFEGQAAMWLEHLARKAREGDAYDFPFVNSELDFRPLLNSIIADRQRGRDLYEIARATHHGIATGVARAATDLCSRNNTDTVVLSGGVFQNELLLSDLKILLEKESLQIWTNHPVPLNDGGISLGQAALAYSLMHELSIAMSIAETAYEEAKQRGNVRVQAVHLRLGLLSGVVKEAPAVVLRNGERNHRCWKAPNSSLKKFPSRFFAPLARSPGPRNPSSGLPASSAARLPATFCTVKNWKFLHWSSPNEYSGYPESSAPHHRSPQKYPQAK